MQYLNKNRAKLNWQQVREIRDMKLRADFAAAYLRKHYSAAGIANKYGVHARTIEKVLAYETWADPLAEAKPANDSRGKVADLPGNGMRGNPVRADGGLWALEQARDIGRGEA